MNASPARLAAALTEPVRENESLRLFLCQDLETRITHAALQRGDLTLEQALATVSAVPNRPRLKVLRWVLASLTALLLAGALEWPKLPALAAIGSIRLPGEETPGQKWLEKTVLPPEAAPPPPRLDDPVVQADPAAYMEAVIRTLNADQPLPADYPMVWRRIDPDNGAWVLLEAEALSRQPLHPGQDLAGMQFKCAQMVELASWRPRNDRYWQQRRRYGFAAYRAPGNWAEAARLEARVRPLADARLPRMAWDYYLRLGRFDRYGTLPMEEQEQQMRQMLTAHGRLVSAYWYDLARTCPRIANVNADSGFATLRDRRIPHLTAEIERRMPILDLALVEETLPRLLLRADTWRTPLALPAAVEQPLAARYPELPALERAELAWLAQAALLTLAAAAWLALFVLALRQVSWGYGRSAQNYERAAWRCAVCLRALAPPSRGDALALLAWGALAPALWSGGWLCWAATGPFLSDFYGPLLGYTALLAAVSGVRIMQARLARRLRVTGFASSAASLWAGRVALVLTAAALPVLLLAGLRANPGHRLPWGPHPVTAVAAALACTGLLWLLRFFHTGFFSPDGAVRHILLARRLIGPLALVTIGLVLIVPFFHLLEQRLVRQATEDMVRPAPCVEALPPAAAAYATWHGGGP